MPTVPNSFPKRIHRVAVALTLLLGWAAFGAAPTSAQTATRTATPVPTVTATPALVRVAISPRAASKQVGGFQSFSAAGFFSDGSSRNYTQKVIYHSSNLGVAFPPNTEGNRGRVDAVGVGSAVISITDPDTGINSDASGESAVFDVVAAPTPTSTSTAPTPTRTVTPKPTVTATPVLVTLQITPLTAKRNVGQTQNFSVKGIYSNGSEQNLTQLATYASSNTNVVQCPNDVTANKGQTIAVGVGVALISASFNGVSTTNTGGDAEFTVTIQPTPTVTRTGATPTPTFTASPTPTATPVLVSLALSPQTTKKGVGGFQAFSVTGTLSNNDTRNYTQKVVYSSSNLAVAFPPNTEGNRGRVEAVGIGTAVISVTDPDTGITSATSNGNATFDVIEAPTPTQTSTAVTPTRTVTPKPTATATPVLVTLQISPATAKRNAGQTQNFSVKGIYSNGDEKNLTQQATYVSSNTNIVECPNDTTTNKGTTLAVGVGVAMISANFNGVSTTNTGGDAEFTVVIPPTPTVTRTGSTPTPTFTPSPTPTSTAVLVSMKLSPETSSKGLGTFQSYSVSGTMSDGTPRNLTQRVIYHSSDESIATAPNDPAFKSRVFAVGVGDAIISAVDTVTGVSTAESGGNASLNVFEAVTPTPKTTSVTPTRTRTPTPTATATPVLLHLFISPTTVKKQVGQFQNFIVNGTYSNGDEKNLTQKVTYISSDPSVAEAKNDPMLGKSKVFAVKIGVAVITAKDPDTGISTVLDESATFTVVVAPTPLPTRTGPTPTSLTPTRTPTAKASPSPTATPKLTAITLSPSEASKKIGSTQNFAAQGLFTDGIPRNVTNRVRYVSSDPTIAEAPNDPSNKSRIIPLKVGTVTISAVDDATGVKSSDSGGDATFTVLEGSGSPRPRATVTPGLPDQTGGNPTTACQRDVRRAARAYVDKKLKALEKCAGAASGCVQKKPGDQKCLAAVRARCAAVLGKLADEEARLIAAVTKRCAGLSGSEVLGEDGLAYGGIANSCLVRFGRTLTDLTSVAQCLAAQHSCRAETIFALERPRAGELLNLVQAIPDAGDCRDDFGGSGLGLGDPKGAGKVLERCIRTLVKGGEAYARNRLASIGRCIDAVFVCVESADGNAVCLTKADQKCDREFAKIQRDVGKITIATGKKCGGLPFTTLTMPEGAHLDAVIPTCPDYGIPTVGSIGDYVACLLRQHECAVADLARFESPRAADMLEIVGRTLVDGTCPAP